MFFDPLKDSPLIFIKAKGNNENDKILMGSDKSILPKYNAILREK